MKSVFVATLPLDQAISCLLLVREKEVRTSARTGRSWLQLELADRTGSISAKMWENFAEIAATFDRDDIVKVRGRVKVYNEEKELTLDEILPAQEIEYDLADFLPHTKENVEGLYARLREFVAETSNPWLKGLLEAILEDPGVAPRLKRAPAAMTMHHAYLGGLLEHIVSVCGLVRVVAAHYPEVDADLLLAGAILHDIGKIDELSYERSFGYTTEGRLLGHMVIALALLRKKTEAIPDFPRRLATLLEHLIVSHHGSYEFGSPRLPMFREAVLLHYLDDLDSKMGAMRPTLDLASGEGEWCDRNPSLRRALLRTEKYLSETAAAAGSKSKAAVPAAAKPANTKG